MKNDIGRKILRWMALSVGALVVLMAGLATWQHKVIVAIAENWGEITTDLEAAQKLRSPEDVLEYIAAHPRTVSLAVWTIGDEGNGIFHNADVKRPLASTVKVLVLAEYAQQVEAGSVDAAEPVDVFSWERYWLPGTDGGAHEAAMKEMRQNSRIVGGKVPLGDVARAMIRYSDNAAADYLMKRFGRARLDSLPARLDLPNEDVPLPLSGSTLTWWSGALAAPAEDLIRRYVAMGRDKYADEVWRLAAKLSEAPAFRAAELDRLEQERLKIRDQAAIAKALDNHGTALGYARLMERVVTGTLAGSAVMREHLEWPMKNESIRTRFKALGTKGGSLPGILTAAYYAEPNRGKPPRVLALFFQDLPTGIWIQLMHTFVHQEFESKLLDEEAFFQRVKERLSTGS